MRKNHSVKKIIKNNLVTNLELPEEIICNLPSLSLIGRTKLIIENFKNIFEYSDEAIKLNTTCGMLKIEGKELLLKELTKTKVLVNGKLTSIEYID